MQLKKLTFSSSEDDQETLETVTVKMTVQEALWIARVSGQQRGSSPHTSIYNCLTGAVFNRFWDDGVQDAERDYRFDIPPIKYEKE